MQTVEQWERLLLMGGVAPYLQGWNNLDNLQSSADTLRGLGIALSRTDGLPCEPNELQAAINIARFLQTLLRREAGGDPISITHLLKER